jgi:uncharacterized LabA/DUF88 family protein
MKVALLIDGGYLRASARAAQKAYDNTFIESFARHCVEQNEYLLRVFYYDAPLFRGKVQLPVSGGQKTFQASDKWLDDLAKLERFAIRRGTLGFRGWKPKTIPIAGGQALTDSDFTPVFEQKGVDMRIGLDIATFARTRAVDRIILVSGDQDMIPALKEARKAGLEVATVQLPHPTKSLHDGLHAHSDMVRAITWP